MHAQKHKEARFSTDEVQTQSKCTATRCDDKSRLDKYFKLANDESRDCMSDCVNDFFPLFTWF